MKLDFRKINSATAFCVVFGVLVYVGISIIFPSFSYYINKTDKFKISILRKNFAGKDFFSVTPLYDYPYKTVNVKINLQEGEFFPDQKIPVSYGYEAEFYPVSSRKILTKEDLEKYLFFENTTNIPNGTLLSNEEAVFFISKGQARPFLGPETFVRLGFDWDNVKNDQEGLLFSFANDEKLNFTSSHPDGTILEFPDGKAYLVWDNERLEISKDVLQRGEDGINVVKVKSSEKNPAGECVVKKNKARKLYCKIDRVDEYNAAGHTYLLETPGAFADRAVEMKMRFSMLGNFDFSVAKESLKRIKDELKARYGEDLMR